VTTYKHAYISMMIRLQRKTPQQNALKEGTWRSLTHSLCFSFNAVCACQVFFNAAAAIVVVVVVVPKVSVS
jgi:hypothetical protein